MYTLTGTVIHGKGNGRKVGMPTANLYYAEGQSFRSVESTGCGPASMASGIQVLPMWGRDHRWTTIRG
ncbi:MAG: riboflavin kinase [Sellimonas intestinalis]